MIFSRRLIVGGVLASASALCAAGTGEFCTLPNAQGVQTTYECAVKFTSQSTWLSSFKTWLNTNKTSGAMACFAPGTFTVPNTLSTNTNLSTDTNRMVLRGVTGLRMCAPQGGAVIEHKTVNADSSPLTTATNMPTLQISTSSNVAVKGITFKNTSVYATSATDPITRAAWAEKSTTLQFADAQFSGPGRGVVTATDSSVNLSSTTVSCGYHCLTGDRGTGATKPSFVVSGSQINVNRSAVPTDENTALWSHYTNFDIGNTTFDFATGQGFVAGFASTVDWVNLSNIAVTGTNPQGRLRMFGWIPTHPNYSNLQVSYTGTPPVGRAYFCIPGATNLACDTGHENAGAQGALFRSRPDATSPFVTAALPPAKVKQLLLLNSDGVGLSWSKQTLMKNAATLSPRGSQAAGSWGGWLDLGNTAVTGSFTAPGQQQVLLFNSNTQGGAFSVRSISGSGTSSQMPASLYIPWTPALVGYWGGWHDADDQLFAGDFFGTGTSQLLFFNRDFRGGGGAFHFAKVNGTTAQVESLAAIQWDAAVTGSFADWLYPGNKVVTGDFMGTGRSQIMIINTVNAPGLQYYFTYSLRQYDVPTNSFVTYVDGAGATAEFIGPSVAMWKQVNNKLVVGDFLGTGRDQLMFLNPTGTGTALSIWSYDKSTAHWTEVYTMNWAAGEITSANLGGLLDPADWPVGY
jgi:hypothetical protein